MFNINCLKCSGSGTMGNQQPCPDCMPGIVRNIPIVQGIPVQYQSAKFDKKFLPEKEQAKYGEFMENLLYTIINDSNYYQKNLLICSRPNSGKTVWAYTLIAQLTAKGYEIPNLKDIVEVRQIMSSYDNKDENILWSTARCAIIKIPRDIQPWLLDSIPTIIERRVRSNGFTIFLYGGTREDLMQADRYEKLKFVVGNGSYNTLKIESF